MGERGRGRGVRGEVSGGGGGGGGGGDGGHVVVNYCHRQRC